MNNLNKIPKEITVGGQIIKIEFFDKLYNNYYLGESSSSAGFIHIANEVNGLSQSDSSKLNTFYHEVIHCILNTLGEEELNSNERFVCAFAACLTEALTSAKYE